MRVDGLWRLRGNDPRSYTNPHERTRKSPLQNHLHFADQGCVSRAIEFSAQTCMISSLFQHLVLADQRVRFARLTKEGHT
jgi:hypothetical protein